jgi:DNA-binding GntR family transcriptional regulator
MNNKHQSNGMKKVIKQLKKEGVVLHETKKGAFLRHPKVKEQYLMHYSERAIHEVRRWAKRNLGIEVKY